MSFIRKCEYCGEQFEWEDEDDIPTRPAELEDCTDPQNVIEICPNCGGDLYKPYGFWR